MIQDTIHIVAENEVIQAAAVMVQFMLLVACSIITIINRKR